MFWVVWSVYGDSEYCFFREQLAKKREEERVAREGEELKERRRENSKEQLKKFSAGVGKYINPDLKWVPEGATIQLNVSLKMIPLNIIIIFVVIFEFSKRSLTHWAFERFIIEVSI